MISHFRKLIALPLAMVLTLTLPSCDSLTYREAVNLYNDQKYDQAAELFSQLEDYEDSPELFQRSRYWEAVQLMELGDYAGALPRFIKLGDYEDSAQRLLECRYQVAVAAFEEGRYDQAEQDFLEFADYQQSAEYLRQINWQKFYDYVLAAGSEAGGCYVLSAQQEDCSVNLMVDMSEPDYLTFYAVWEKEMGYLFRDCLKISLTRDSLEAAFTADSAFSMDFKGNTIGSQQVAEGRFSISGCTADTELTADTFHMTSTDNQGKVTDSTNPADGTLFAKMQENYAAIMTVFPQFLADSGLGLAPADLGFEALA